MVCNKADKGLMFTWNNGKGSTGNLCKNVFCLFFSYSLPECLKYLAKIYAKKQALNVTHFYVYLPPMSIYSMNVNVNIVDIFILRS